MQTVREKSFEGPLDLLLNLIEREKLDISKIALAKITNNYLEEISKIDASSENLADFLVVASKLLYLKSKAVLPVLAPEEEEEIDDLEAQLREYKKYKEAASEFEKILKENKRAFEANVLPVKTAIFLPPANINLEILANLLKDALEKMEKEEIIEKKHDRKITLEEKLDHLKGLLSKSKRVSFKSVVGKAKSKGEVVVTFLALLEMIRRKMVMVEQKQNFGDLTIKGI